MVFGKKVVVSPAEKYTRTINVTTPYITVVLTTENADEDMNYLIKETEKILKEYKKYHITDNREDIR